MSRTLRLAALYGAADALFAPAFTGRLPGTVSPINLQPASRAARVEGVRTRARPASCRHRGGAFLFDAATFAVSIARLVPLRPRLVADVLHDEDPEASTTDSLSLKEGWVEVRSRSWVTSFLGGMASYHAAAIFVLGGCSRRRR